MTTLTCLEHSHYFVILQRTAFISIEFLEELVSRSDRPVEIQSSGRCDSFGAVHWLFLYVVLCRFNKTAVFLLKLMYCSKKQYMTGKKFLFFMYVRQDLQFSGKWIFLSFEKLNIIISDFPLA